MKKITLRFREVDRDKFDDVKNGLKTVETRAATSRYKDIQAGDLLIVVCGKDRIEKTVVASKHFDSVEAMLKECNLKQILPSANSVEDAYKMYYSFPGYKEKLDRYGVMAFELG